MSTNNAAKPFRADIAAAMGVTHTGEFATLTEARAFADRISDGCRNLPRVQIFRCGVLIETQNACARFDANEYHGALVDFCF